MKLVRSNIKTPQLVLCLHCPSHPPCEVTLLLLFGPLCSDIILVCELEMLGVPTPLSPGWSFRLTVPLSKVIVFHMQAGPGCLWEQRFGCKD